MLTLEEAVNQAIEAREEHHLALGKLAVRQYQHELRQKLGKLAFLLELREKHGGGKR